MKETTTIELKGAKKTKNLQNMARLLNALILCGNKLFALMNKSDMNIEK